jgi:hypothetical protein
LPAPFQYDLDTYPFLRNPQVYVQFRPGFLEQLAFLAELGVDLMLITASSGKRVDFLFKRFPVLDHLFGKRVLTAEESARILFEIEELPDSEIRQQSELNPGLVDACLKAHKNRPCSLAAKTPLLIERALGLSGFKLLIDDSEVTADIFAGVGLDKYLVPVTGQSMDRSQTDRIIKEVYDRLDLPMTPPENPLRMGVVHVEDPYYYPLIHMQDQLT